MIVHTSRWLCCAFLCILLPFLPLECAAQVIVDSKPILCKELDEPLCVADYQDSVYVVTMSGWVLVYDTLFLHERVLLDATRLRATSVFVYDNALFFQSAGGRFLIQENGSQQYLDLSPGIVGRDAAMMPIVVTPTGTYEVRRNASGSFVPVKTSYHVPFSMTIRELLHAGNCVVALYEQTADRRNIPATLHRADGSTVEFKRPVSEFTNLVPLPNGRVVQSDWLSARLITDACSETPSVQSIVGDDGLFLRPYAGTQRTHPLAPYAVIHWGLDATTSALYVFADSIAKLQKWYSDSAYHHLHCAVSNKAVYMWNTDGWIVRQSLSGDEISVRSSKIARGRNLQIEKTGVDGKLTGFLAVASTEGRVRAKFLVGDMNSCHVVPDSLLDAHGIGAFVRPKVAGRIGSDVWIMDVDTNLVIGPLSNEWRLFPQEVPPPSRINISAMMDSTAFLRYNQLYQVVDGEPLSRKIHVEVRGLSRLTPRTALKFGSGHLLIDQGHVRFSTFSANRDTLLVDSVAVLSSRQYIIVPPHGDTLTVFFAVPGDSVFPDFTQSIKEIRMYRFNTDFDIIDSTVIEPQDIYGGYSRQFVGDTLYYFDLRTGMVKSIWPGAESKWRRVLSVSGMATFPKMTAYPTFWPVSTTTTLMSANGRVYEIDFTKELPAVSVDETESLDVVSQHIFMMNVYPNPGSLRATVEMRRHSSSEASATELFLVDLVGNKVRDFSDSADFRFTVGTIGRTTVDYAGIPSGQYLLVMRNSGVTSSKLVSIAR